MPGLASHKGSEMSPHWEETDSVADRSEVLGAGNVVTVEGRRASWKQAIPGGHSVRDAGRQHARGAGRTIRRRRFMG